MKHDNFYIAAIGASAGGLQALKDFFENIPPSPGIAFCVITHLLRDHRSVLDKILSKYTHLTVRRMKGADIVRPNTVYVMPEDEQAYLRNGCIYLKKRRPDQLLNRTIDDFFSSLAEDQHEKAIGIIFSGMGDDGSRGVQLIHEFGGIVLVQDPQSTAFKSMPEKAIQRDHPDQVLPPALIAKTILAEIQRRNVPVDRS